MTGETGFNEVLFENLVVSDRYRLDEEGAGWKVAMTTLVHERGAGLVVTPASGGLEPKENLGAQTQSVKALIELAKRMPRNGKTAADDPLIRDELIKMLIRYEGFVQNQRRSKVSALVDNAMRIPLQTKLVGTEMAQDLQQIAYDIEGAASTLYAVSYTHLTLPTNREE